MRIGVAKFVVDLKYQAVVGNVDAGDESQLFEEIGTSVSMDELKFLSGGTQLHALKFLYMEHYHWHSISIQDTTSYNEHLDVPRNSTFPRQIEQEASQIEGSE